MLAPQLGFGVFVLLLTVGHIGTSVPLLVTWLVLDRARPGWRLAVATGILLTWGAVADPLVLAVGSLPLALVCGLRVIQGLFGDPARDAEARHRQQSRHARTPRDGDPPVRGLPRRRRGGLGRRLPAPGPADPRAGRLHAARGHVHDRARQQVAQRRWRPPGAGCWCCSAPITRACPPGTTGTSPCCTWPGWPWSRWRWSCWPGASCTTATLVDQVLGAAIAVNVLLYVISNMPSLNPHEMAVVLPCGAALAGRMLVRAAARDVPAAPPCPPRNAAARSRRWPGPRRPPPARSCWPGTWPGWPGRPATRPCPRRTPSSHPGSPRTT